MRRLLPALALAGLLAAGGPEPAGGVESALPASVPGLAAAKAGDLLPFVWGGSILSLEVEKVSPSSTRERTVVRGRLAGEPGSSVTIVHRDGILAGAVERAGRKYTLQHASAGRHVVLEDAKDLPPCGGSPPPEPLPEAVGMGSPATASLAAGDPVIDVMILYTALAAAQLGGGAALEADLELRIEQANEAYANSLVPQRVRLVHMRQVDYAETGTSTDLFRLRHPSDGYLDEVPVLRNDYGADLVSLVIRGSTQWAGLGYLFRQGGTSDVGYSLVTRPALAQHCLTHEMGHNMGCQHDAYWAASQGYFPYSYGYQTPDFQCCSIMAQGAGRVSYFSNPDVQVNYYGHLYTTFGTADANNALTLTNTAPLVAAFRPATKIYWDPIGNGLGYAGTSGVPRIVGRGTVNGVENPRVKVEDPLGTPGVTGYLIIGLAEADLPFRGGRVRARPDYVIQIPAGFALPLPTLAGLPSGTQVFFQWWVQDGGPQGWRASEGWRATVP